MEVRADTHPDIHLGHQRTDQAPLPLHLIHQPLGVLASNPSILALDKFLLDINDLPVPSNKRVVVRVANEYVIEWQIAVARSGTRQPLLLVDLQSLQQAQADTVFFISWGPALSRVNAMRYLKLSKCRPHPDRQPSLWHRR